MRRYARLRPARAARTLARLPGQGLREFPAADAGQAVAKHGGFHRAQSRRFHRGAGRNAGLRGRPSFLCAGRGRDRSLSGHRAPPHFAAAPCAPLGLPAARWLQRPRLRRLRGQCVGRRTRGARRHTHADQCARNGADGAGAPPRCAGPAADARRRSLRDPARPDAARRAQPHRLARFRRSRLLPAARPDAGRAGQRPATGAGARRPAGVRGGHRPAYRARGRRRPRASPCGAPDRNPRRPRRPDRHGPAAGGLAPRRRAALSAVREPGIRPGRRAGQAAGFRRPGQRGPGRPRPAPGLGPLGARHRDRAQRARLPPVPAASSRYRPGLCRTLPP
ncbi:hypothetical protein D3C72_1133870 [compost metagenome]